MRGLKRARVAELEQALRSPTNHGEGTVWIEQVWRWARAALGSEAEP